MFVRTILGIVTSAFIGLVAQETYAADFRALECATVQPNQGGSYNVNVPCKATVVRGEGGRWYNAPRQECSSFCRSIGGVSTFSSDGWACTSGEARPPSAIGVVDYSPTGCWHDCRFPEGRTGATSVGHQCYAPGQKRDYDRTDITVGCYCATGDVNSNAVELGVYAAASAQTSGVNYSLIGWAYGSTAVMNDSPGRVVYVRGAFPKNSEASVNFVVNVQGSCGTSVVLSGRANGSSGGTPSSSNDVVITLPACANPCGDGIDNDRDGAIDSADFSCGASNGQSEQHPQAACANGIDDDKDGRIDQADPGCTGSQDNSEDGGSSACEPPVDNSDDLAKLEEIIRAQRVVVYEMLDPIIKTTTDCWVKARAQELRDQADTIKRDLVRDMYRNYPKTTQLCPSCPVKDLTMVKDSLVSQSRRMQRLTRQVAFFVRGLNPGAVVRPNLQTASNLFDQFSCAAWALPDHTSLCPK